MEDTIVLLSNLVIQFTIISIAKSNTGDYKQHIC